MKYALSLLMLNAALIMAADHAEENIAPNPSFEWVKGESREAPPWRLPSPVYALTTKPVRTGQRSLHYSNDNPERYQLASCELELQAGRQYYFEVWVRTRDVRGDDNGATICMEWWGDDGQYLGGAYPHGIKGTRMEWTRVHGVTRPIPENAVRCSVTCYVRKTMTGEAWFDDVLVAQYFPPLLEAVTADAYRGIYQGGPATVYAGLSLADQDLSPEAVEATLSVADDHGAVPAKTADEVNGERAVFTVDMDALAPGDYTATVRIQTTDGTRGMSQSITLRKAAGPVNRSVCIDRHGRTLVDGKPFFPLGTYWGGVTEEHLELYADSAFNCLMPYGSPDAKTMDLIETHGLKVIYSIKDYYAGSKYCPDWIQTEADERPAVERTVVQYRDHPALLAWYINDELPLSMLDRLSAHRRWVEELDPNHPSWVVLYQIGDVRRYLPSFDVIGTDPYPIPDHPAARALDWTRRTRSATFGCRGVWMVPQIFDWGAYRKKDDPAAFRPPTLLEMRSMAWQCVAAGANGMIFYSWFDLWRMNQKDPFDRRWKEVKTMASEIERFIPVILSVDPVPDVQVRAPDTVAWRAWRKDGQVFLLVVNSGDDRAAATVSCRFKVTEAVRAFDGEPMVHGSAGMTVELEALEPAMIRIPLP